MNEKTQSDYKKLAAHFYKNKLNGEQPTPKRIADALKACASDYRPAYWRKLRNALAFDQSDKGYKDAAERINKTQNPITKDGSKLDVKPKQKRIKSINSEDEEKLVAEFVKNDDRQSWAAIMLTKHLGARPSEFAEIRVIGDKVFISGAKKSHGNLRGADRQLTLNAKELGIVKAALGFLKNANVGAVQDRIRAAGKRLWPQRKSVPSLYSWRHQLGSDLKASGLNRTDVAYIMGHQSTASVNVYGNKKTGSGARSLPMPLSDADLSNIREVHTSKPPAHALGQSNEHKASASALRTSKFGESTLSM